jgi:hypothetical protein
MAFPSSMICRRTSLSYRYLTAALSSQKTWVPRLRIRIDTGTLVTEARAANQHMASAVHGRGSSPQLKKAPFSHLGLSAVSGRVYTPSDSIVHSRIFHPTRSARPPRLFICSSIFNPEITPYWLIGGCDAVWAYCFFFLLLLLDASSRNNTSSPKEVLRSHETIHAGRFHSPKSYLTHHSLRSFPPLAPLVPPDFSNTFPISTQNDIHIEHE